MCLGFGAAQVLASGLPKSSVQALMKALQDSNVEVRTAAAQVFAQIPDAAQSAVKPLESALVASADGGEQDALVKALILADESESEIDRDLSCTSFLSIFGGPILTVACLAYLCFRLGFIPGF